MQNNVFSTNKTWNVRGRLYDVSTPKVMGVLNVTPDSFYEGSRFPNLSAAIQQVEKMVSEGADMIDVGGYSSRPGATHISEEEELTRVIPVIKEIADRFPKTLLSIDTFRSGVARQALDAGASMINDISGGESDPAIPALAAEYETPYIVMHMRGTPQTMAQLTQYDNLLKEVRDFFHKKINYLTSLGLKDLVIDPGFGFAKTTDQNFELLNSLDSLKIFGVPVLVGLSRKSMIWRTLKITAEEALNGTTVLNSVALLKGASILRVHDVRQARECVLLFNKLNHISG